MCVYYNTRSKHIDENVKMGLQGELENIGLNQIVCIIQSLAFSVHCGLQTLSLYMVYAWQAWQAELLLRALVPGAYPRPGNVKPTLFNGKPLRNSKSCWVRTCLFMWVLLLDHTARRAAPGSSLLGSPLGPRRRHPFLALLSTHPFGLYFLSSDLYAETQAFLLLRSIRLEGKF